MLDMENEIWKDIEGFDGKYSVSNFGRVRSNGFYVIPNSDKVKPFWKAPKILKPWSHNMGYYCVSLGRKNKKLIHRLVASAFLPNPNQYKDVNHINGIKTDNNIQNLEWCNRSQNMLHAYEIGLKECGFKHKNTLSCLHLETGIFYKSAVEAVYYSSYRFSETEFRRRINSDKNNTGFILI